MVRSLLFIRATPDEVPELEARGWEIAGGHWHGGGAAVLLVRVLRDDAPAGEECTGGDW